MVERLTQQKDNILQTLKSHKHKLQLPTEAEWEKLVKIKQLLAPCKEASDTFGGDHYVSCSVVLPALHNLMKIMTATDDDPQ